MEVLDVKLGQDGYTIKATNSMIVCWLYSTILYFIDSTYFYGRCADVFLKDKVIGSLGVLHPDVLSQFELTMPASVLEINIEPLV